MSYAITLTESAPGSGIFSFASGAFFPIDGQLLGDYGFGHNYHFTYQIHATFGYTPGAGQVFNFSGDDDVWVFFDKKLGIDLGGVHGTAGASVNMDTLLRPRQGRRQLRLRLLLRRAPHDRVQLLDLDVPGSRVHAGRHHSRAGDVCVDARRTGPGGLHGRRRRKV